MTEGVKFKDKTTGSEVVFTSEYDISQMRQHPEYEEVKEQTPKVTKK